ncbi:hypothetical protein [Massilia violaceinigra]|uniref:hypothetical protein n=1 Tax=Massilia violaceinigra TaxID=2045208 RepID=UPI0012FDAD99|nr:hypothetical protein [Massilia violaceinigra]
MAAKFNLQLKYIFPRRVKKATFSEIKYVMMSTDSAPYWCEWGERIAGWGSGKIEESVVHTGENIEETRVLQNAVGMTKRPGT